VSITPPWPRGPTSNVMRAIEDSARLASYIVAANELQARPKWPIDWKNRLHSRADKRIVAYPGRGQQGTYHFAFIARLERAHAGELQPTR